MDAVTEVIRPAIHYGLHLLVPFVLGRLFFGKALWWKAGLFMLAAMLLDLDHFLASPVFDPNRCSIGFHPLHTVWAMAIYALMLLIPSWKWRAVALGCLLHLGADGLDCVLGGTW